MRSQPLDTPHWRCSLPCWYVYSVFGWPRHLTRRRINLASKTQWRPNQQRYLLSTLRLHGIRPTCRNMSRSVIVSVVLCGSETWPVSKDKNADWGRFRLIYRRGKSRRYRLRRLRDSVSRNPSLDMVVNRKVKAAAHHFADWPFDSLVDSLNAESYIFFTILLELLKLNSFEW